jgi:autotransporter-associated beta strand protein
MANRSTYRNKVTGGGTLKAYCVTEKGTNYYATRTPVECDFSAFEGTLQPTSSLDDPAVLRFTLNTETGMPKGTMDIASGVEVQNSGKTFRIGRVSGAGALGGSCTFSNNTSVGANTWQVGNDEDWTWSGKVTSNANFVKVGTGKMLFKGNSTNTGTTTVSEGELQVSSSVLGTGRLTVNDGATLSGINTAQKPLTNSSVTINGTVRPGAIATSNIGTLYFDSKNVTFGATGVLLINVKGSKNDQGETTVQNTSLAGIGTLVMNGTIRIISSGLSTGTTIQLWTADSMTGTPKFDLPTGYQWDTSRISEGLLIVKGITTGVTRIDNSETESNKRYNLNGQRVDQHYKGFVIVDGKKVMKK